MVSLAGMSVPVANAPMSGMAVPVHGTLAPLQKAAVADVMVAVPLVTISVATRGALATLAGRKFTGNVGVPPCPDISAVLSADERARVKSLLGACWTITCA